ncbi:MAG: hypothetical protein A2Z88_07365 [Omnitrophica WOR_2 bacterium GWA2_47_8]|nr:MAG: hypothetical protein A2Z88_07365 [Omnitrophica WOR_2 bacterium GWA2_47_8]
MVNKTRKKKGQSTIEYILLVTAVIIIFLLFLGRGGIFQHALGNTLLTTQDAMQNAANKLRFGGNP